MSVADRLAKLAELHASGALTDEEYAQAKAQVLAHTDGGEPPDTPEAAVPLPPADASTSDATEIPARRTRTLAVAVLLVAIIAAVAATSLVFARSVGEPPNVPTLADSEQSSCDDSEGDQVDGGDPGEAWADIREVRLEADTTTLLVAFVVADDVPETSDVRGGDWKVHLHDPASSTDLVIGAARLFDPEEGQEPWSLSMVDNTRASDIADPTALEDALIDLDPSAIRVDGNVVSFRVPISELPSAPESVDWVATAISAAAPMETMDLLTNRSYDHCPDDGSPSTERVANLSLNQWYDSGPWESLALPGEPERVVSGSDVPTLQPSPSEDNPTPSPSTPGTTPAPRDDSAGACPGEPTERIGPEQAARCFYRAWKAGDRALARTYASDEAVDELFEYDWEPPKWKWLGCAESAAASTGYSCNWDIPAPEEVHGVYVEMHLGAGPSVGNHVEAIEFYG